MRQGIVDQHMTSYIFHASLNCFITVSYVSIPAVFEGDFEDLDEIMGETVVSIPA